AARPRATHSCPTRRSSDLPAERRRTSGILLDRCFGHCLARAWDDYASESLPQFTNRVYRVLTATPELPGQLARIAPRMAAQDWRGSYRDFATLPRVVNAMRHRLSRPQLLEGAEDELARLYDALWADFREFYPQLMRFADGQRNP